MDPEWDFRRDQALYFNDNWKAMNLLEFIQTHSKHQVWMQVCPEALDKNIEGFDFYIRRLRERVGRLKFYVRGVKQLGLVSTRWRTALRRHAAALESYLDAYDVIDELEAHREFTNEVRVDYFGPRGDSESDSDDGPGPTYESMNPA